MSSASKYKARKRSVGLSTSPHDIMFNVPQSNPEEHSAAARSRIRAASV